MRIYLKLFYLCRFVFFFWLVQDIENLQATLFTGGAEDFQALPSYSLYRWSLYLLLDRLLLLAKRVKECCSNTRRRNSIKKHVFFRDRCRSCGTVIFGIKASKRVQNTSRVPNIYVNSLFEQQSCKIPLNKNS